MFDENDPFEGGKNCFPFEKLICKDCAKREGCMMKRRACYGPYASWVEYDREATRRLKKDEEKEEY
jgi:hypothetical protein